MKNDYLEIVKYSVTGRLDTKTPSSGWKNTREFNGFDYGFPSSARTMVGVDRLDNIKYCIEEVLKNDIAGDFVELGCWRGGAGIFMKACLKVLASKSSDAKRKVWLADTFAYSEEFSEINLSARIALYILSLIFPCLPRSMKEKAVRKGLNNNFPPEELSPETLDSMLTEVPRYLKNPKPFPNTSLEDVQEAFRRYQLLDENVIFLKGWFSETLPQSKINQVSILRLDGDFYQSTMDGLNSLYHKLSPGGFCIVDDYFAFPECRAAVADFMKAKSLNITIERVDEECVFWQKPK